MDIRLKIYGIARAILPRRIQDLIAGTKMTSALRNIWFRNAGSPRLVQVESAIGSFRFTAPIQVAHKASTRGIEATISRLLQRACKPGSICIDVGANYGFLSLVMADCIKPNGRVIAFEPNDFAYRVLIRNIEDNDLLDVCNIYHAALAKYQSSSFEMVSRLGTSHHPETGESPNSTIPAYTLDQVVQKNMLASVDLIKIDVDGIEFDILLGAESTINRFHPVIIVELNKESTEIVDLLSSKGYLLYDIKGKTVDELTSPLPGNLVACTAQQAKIIWTRSAHHTAVN